MILRPRQRSFVDRCCASLKAHKRTLGIAPTGAGKTIMLAGVAGELGGTQLVLQHRDELVDQNEKKFRKVNPKIRTDFFVADQKRWARGGVTFGMIQTLKNDKNLATMPRLDRIIIDEGHHAVADSYLKVIHHAEKLNPDLELLLVTATPGRGDRRTLRTLVDNIADQITLGELIAEGHLVRPRAFVIDVGMRGELDAERGRKKTFNDIDHAAVEKIMNKRAINDKVVEKWREHAGDRQTVVFTSTIQHAKDVLDAYRGAGVSAEMIWGEDPDRADKLKAYDQARFQVIINVAVLTEGWDHQPTSCVVLLRMESNKDVLMQMVGRGLRTVDPEIYPGVRKDDCIILDFGYSLHVHRDLEQRINLNAELGPKTCPKCGATVPGVVYDCGICGFEWPRPPAEQRGEGGGESSGPGELTDFVMTEIDLFESSPFRWEDLFGGVVTLASALTAWACVLNYQGRWVAIGGAEEKGVAYLADNADRLMSLAAADDFLREYGDDKQAKKSKGWLNQPPTDQQCKVLGLDRFSAMAMSRYRATCLIQWKFSERAIKHKVTNNVRAAA